MAFTELQYNSLGPLTVLTTAEGGRTWDFMLMFEETVLIIGPLALGCLLILVEVSNKIGRGLRKCTRPFAGATGWIKSALYLVLLILCITLTVQLSTYDIYRTSWTTGVAIMSITAACFAALDNLMHHTYALKPSSPAQLLLDWWLLSDAVCIRSRWLFGGDNRLVAITMILLMITKLALIVTEESSKRSILLPSQAGSSPESRAGINNRILLAWLNPLMYRSLRRTVAAHELWPVDDKFRSHAIRQHMNDTYSGSLFIALLKENWWYWLAPVPTRVAQAGFSFAQPFLIYQMLSWLYIPTDDSEVIGYGILGAFACIYIGIALTTAFGQYQVVRLLARIRASLMARIYRKSLQLRTSQVEDLSALTLISTNVDIIVEGFMCIQEVIISLIMLGVGLWLLERQIGLGAIGPVITVVVAAITIGLCVPGMNKAQKGWLNAIKTRVQFASMALAGVQSLKMAGLSNYIFARLQGLRLIELRKSIALRRYLVMTVSTSLGMPNLSPMLALAVYAVVLRNQGSTLNAISAFTALAYIVLITFPLLVVMQTAPIVIQAFSCLSQIEEFLRKSDERRPAQQDTDTSPLTEKRPMHSERPNDVAISLVNCSFRRDSTDEEPVLSGINIDFTSASFTQIIGPSASGKTTLLEAILGEMICTAGDINFGLHGEDIAFVPQKPWVRNASVRSNIMLTSAIDEQWYREVLRACALDRDLDLVSSDLELRGTTLSGGQKQKVSLARAIYSRRKIFIIDEPFTGIDGSSVDLITQRLFGRDGLLRRHGITLILASHSRRLLPNFDYAVELSADGRVAQQGAAAALNLDKYKQYPTRRERKHDEITPVMPDSVVAALSKNDKSDTAATESEERDHRKGELAVYRYYFASLGLPKLMAVVFFVAAFVFFQLFTQPWITWWTGSNLGDANNNMGYWLGWYAAFGVLAILSLAAACWFMLVQMVTSSGASLHAILCSTMARAHLSLMSTSSAGQIINRFSQDMTLVDMELPMALSSLAITFMLSLGQVGLILSASKYLSATLPLIVIACLIIQRLYIKTSRQLRFHEIETKAPLYTQFVETLEGLTSVRAYKLEQSVQEEMDVYIDDCQKPWYLLLCAQRYLGLLLNLTVTGLVVIVIGIAIAMRGRSDISFFGQSMVNIMTFGQNLTMVIDYWTKFEISLAAVERTKQFADDTPQEVTESADVDALESFEDGEIVVEDLSVEYNPGVPVLDHVNLHISPGEKVALCGRSGSGKSSLCFAMLRMLEPTSGHISIDDREIAHIPHEQLRKAIAAVPQVPITLDDTLRVNLDPLGDQPDDAVLSALRTVGLDSKFTTAAEGLQTSVSSSALSMAEKQLICLARALLKRSKVLLLDEATSSVDVSTDGKIQQIVCKTLPETTVVSVMHRFDHILLYDRVVIMSDGSIVEDGRPAQLLSDASSHFAQLHAAEQGSDDEE